MTFYENFTPDVIFPSLKHFAIRLISDNGHDQWKTFFTGNPSIESLDIGLVVPNELYAEIINVMINLPNLRDVKLNIQSTTCNKMFDIMKVYLKNLRTVGTSALMIEDVNATENYLNKTELN